MPEESSQEFVFGDLDGMLADDLTHSLVAQAGDPIRDATFQRLWLAEERLRQERFEERLAFSAAVKESEAESKALAEVEAMERAEVVAAVAADMTSQEPRPKRLATRKWPRPRPRPRPRPVPDEDDHFLDEQLRVAENARTKSFVAAPSAAATVAAIGSAASPGAAGLVPVGPAVAATAAATRDGGAEATPSPLPPARPFPHRRLLLSCMHDVQDFQ